MKHIISKIKKSLKKASKDELLTPRNLIILLLITLLNSFMIHLYLNPLFVILFLFGIVFLTGLYLFIKIPDKHKKTIFISLTISFLAYYLIIMTVFAPAFTERMDRDELLTATSTMILSGKSPYEARWVVGEYVAINRVNVLPFSLIYSIPFYLFGNVAFQDLIAYLFIVYIIYIRYTGKTIFRNSFSLYLLVLFSVSPITCFEFMGLSDLLTGIALFLGAVHFATKKKIIPSTIFLSLSMLTRLVLWPPAGLLAGYYYRRVRTKKFLTIGITITIIITAFMIPFYLWDGEGFLNNTLGSNQGKLNIEGSQLFRLIPIKDISLIFPGILLLYSIIAGYFSRNFHDLSLHFGILMIILFSTMLMIALDYSHLTWMAVPLYFSFKSRKIKNNKIK